MKAFAAFLLVSAFFQVPPARAQTVAVGRGSGTLHHLSLTEGRDIRFRSIANAERLSQTRVGQIVQDNQGFIWFGTQYGLNRYDGYTFKVFLHDPKRADSLGGVYIYALFKDSSGALWIGCDQSLDRFDPTTEKFSHYQLAPSSEFSVPVTQISQDSTGLLWLATSNGLFRFDPRTGARARYQHFPSDPASLSSSNIKASLEDRSGAFWIATSEGIDKFDRETGKVQFHVAQHESRAVFLHEDRAGLLWVTHVSNKGPDILDREARRLIPISAASDRSANEAFKSMGVMLEDHEGNLWVGSRGAGLFRFDRANHQFVRYRNDPGDPSSLTENVVNSLFEDGEDNIWVGLSGKSPCIFSIKRPQFEALPNPANTKELPTQSLITSLLNDANGDTWIGSYGPLRLLKRGSTSDVRLPAPPRRGIADIVAMTQDHDGNLWMGTFTDGLKEHDVQTGRLKVFRHDAHNPSSLSSDVIGGLMVGRDGVLWVSTWNGFDRFDRHHETFTTFRPEAGVASPLFLSMAEDEAGKIWIGSHYSGLYRFDPATLRFTAFRHQSSVADSLSDNRVNATFVDRSHRLWIATQNGLDWLGKPEGAFHALYETDGLAGNAVSCIQQDERGLLWMGTNKGVSSFNPETSTFENYFVSDGLPGDDLTGWAACTKGPNGTLFFGGFDGGVAVRPREVRDVQSSPSVVLTSLRLSGREIDAGNALLPQPISRLQVLSLPHSQDNFSLEFAALSYVDPLATRYRYRLNGLDHDWNLAGSNQRVVTYTKLPPGRYTFVVEAASARSTWSPGTALQIRIIPAWWATWWFRTLYTLAAITLAASLYLYRLHELRALYAVRLEERVRERTRIARELHDTLLQGFYSLLLRFQVASDSLPSHEAGRGLIDDALQRADRLVVESRERIRELRVDHSTPLSLHEELVQLGAELQQETLVSFEVFSSGDVCELRAGVHEELLLAGSEAIINAFNHSKGSVIRAELRYRRRLFVLAVSDNGRGISPEVLAAGGSPGHWGLPGMRERMDKIGGKLKIGNLVPRGTGIVCEVPAALAYVRTARAALHSFLVRSR